MAILTEWNYQKTPAVWDQENWPLSEILDMNGSTH